MSTSVVFSGGPAPDIDTLSRLEHVLAELTVDRVVAADSGLHLAQDLGVAVDLLIGDMDSVDEDRLAAAVSAGTVVDRHPEDKDATDLELALDAAMEGAPARVVVMASPTGRMDHLLGSVLTLSAPRLARARVEAWLGTNLIVPVHHTQGTRTIAGARGRVISLVPVHGDAIGVTTSGLAWTLTNETLKAGSSKAMSNRFTAPTAALTVGWGCVAAVVPSEGEL